MIAEQLYLLLLSLAAGALLGISFCLYEGLVRRRHWPQDLLWWWLTALPLLLLWLSCYCTCCCCLHCVVVAVVGEEEEVCVDVVVCGGRQDEGDLGVLSEVE